MLQNNHIPFKILSIITHTSVPQVLPSLETYVVMFTYSFSLVFFFTPSMLSNIWSSIMHFSYVKIRKSCPVRLVRYVAQREHAVLSQKWCNIDGCVCAASSGKPVSCMPQIGSFWCTLLHNLLRIFKLNKRFDWSSTRENKLGISSGFRFVRP